jgi:hypothetical protein
VNRPYELACDRVAIEAVGAPATGQMLRRIVAVEAMDRLGAWFHPLSTHPDPDERIAVVAGSTPASELAHQRARWALGSWLGAGLLATLLAFVAPIAAGWALTGLAALPWIVRIVAAVRVQRRLRSLAPAFPWPSVVLSGLAIGLCAPLLVLLMQGPGALSFLLFVWGIAMIAIAASVTGPRSRIAAAINGNKPADALKVRIGALAKRDPIIRHDRALAKILTGDKGAADELEVLIQDRPRFHIVHHSLGALLTFDEPERALRHALRLRELRPDLPEAPCSAARALIELGRFDEAEEQAAAALALEARFGAHVGAIVAARRGDLDLARSRAKLAAEADPGSGLSRIAAVEVALASGDRASARALLPAAKAAILATPASRLMVQYDRLAAAIEAEPSAG